MDAVRVGRSLRALRLRRGLRQIDVADRAIVSRSTISNIERGALAPVSIGTLQRAANALGAEVDVRIRWHGAELDRLLDQGHAQLVDAMARRLRRLGWDVGIEVTFSIYGERGSIDLLAFHPDSATLLVVEVKTVVPDLQSMVAGLDRKVRLAPRIAGDRGWARGPASSLLVIEAGSTSRDRVARLGSSLDAAFPDRGVDVRRWLRSPSRRISGLLFVRSANRRGSTDRSTGRQRVRRPRSVRTANPAGDPDPSPAGAPWNRS